MYPQNQLAGQHPPQRFVNFIPELSNTVKNGGTLTLTNESTNKQYLTGTSTHIVILPVVATLIIGTQFDIENGGSSGNVTVRSSGGDTIVTLSGGISAIFSSVSNTGVGANVWVYRVKTIPIFNPRTRYAFASGNIGLNPNEDYIWSTFNSTINTTSSFEFDGRRFICLKPGWYGINLSSKSSFQPVVIEWRFSRPITGVVTNVTVGSTFITYTCNNSFSSNSKIKVEGVVPEAYNFVGQNIYNITPTSFDIYKNYSPTVGAASNGLDIANITELNTAANISTFAFPYEGQLKVATSNGPQIINYTGYQTTKFTGITTSGSGILSTGGTIDKAADTAGSFISGGVATAPGTSLDRYYFTGFINGLLSQTWGRVMYMEFGDNFFFKNPGIWTISGGIQELRIDSLF